MDACNYAPAYTSSAISVGAVLSTSSMTYFGNWDDCVDIYSGITNSDNSYASIEGTSIASPHMCDFITNLLLVDLSLTYNDIESMLIGSKYSNSSSSSSSSQFIHITSGECDPDYNEYYCIFHCIIAIYYHKITMDSIISKQLMYQYMKTSYWMTANFMELRWSGGGLIEGAMNSDTYECYDCSECDIDDKDDYSGHNTGGICKPSVISETSIDYSVVEVCGFAVESSDNKIETMTQITTNFEYRPSIGTDGRFCVCYEPG